MSLGPIEILRSAEALAREVDALDTADADELPEEIAATLSARRQRLLIDLDACGVFDGLASTREELVRHGLESLVGYHDAATALGRYLASPERAALVPGVPPPRKLLDSMFSLDWFRRPGSDRGHPLPRHVFAGWCERMMKDTEDTDGMSWVKFVGKMHVVHYRREVAAAPRLYRAGERLAAVALTVDPAPLAGKDVLRDWASATPRFVSGEVAVEVPREQLAVWLDALDRVAARVVGGMHGGARWEAYGDRYELRAGDKAVEGKRQYLADLTGVVADDVGVAWKYGLDRVDPKIAMHPAAAAYAARDLAWWLGRLFMNETGIEVLE
ncbi:MAG: hypothetical protein K8W52_40695 [Deltaproteobacteria bacterium]|nr:hypothetical protein [Deltaproteobacteria bacterium]